MSFQGRDTYNLDDKNRLVLPANFRTQLDDQSVIALGFDNCIVIYPADEWQRYSTSLLEQPSSAAEVRMIIRYLVGSGSQVQIDKQNRLKIPNDFISELAITKECVVMGVNNHIEIWAKERWLEYHNMAKVNLAALAEKHQVGGF